MYYPIANQHKSKFTYDFFNLEVTVNTNNFFRLQETKITPGFLSLKNKKDCLRLEKNPLSFYQNQFNMAVWFATTGCGISIDDHLNHSDPLLRSIYRFHVYYQILKIMKNLEIPIPGESDFNETNNNINRRKLGGLLSEFGLKDEYDFSVFENNGGWRSWSVPDYNPNITDPGYYINDSKINFFLMQVHENRMPPMFSKDWDAGMANFKYPDIFIKDHVRRHKNVFDVITQNECQTYQQFMIFKSNGFSNPGIERLNDTIRTYVYCILGAQALTRTPIIGVPGTELDAQKEFNKLLKDSINQHPDIPTSIQRYQKAVSDTHTRLDYVIAPGLYVIGSNMVLVIGKLDNYNNNILIAPKNAKPGKNDINHKKTLPPPLMEGNSSKKIRVKSSVGTVKTDFVLRAKLETSHKPKSNVDTPKTTETSKNTPTTTKLDTKVEKVDDTHETIKFMLYSVVGTLIVFMVR